MYLNLKIQCIMGIEVSVSKQYKQPQADLGRD